MNSYSIAKQEDFANHHLAKFIRNDFCERVAQVVGYVERYKFKGSAGQGNWARGPWVAVFDKLVTDGAQSGYYPVYLFCEDMSGVYLSLNQGVTEAKKLYKSDAKTALQARAANYRAMLGSQIAPFSELAIDLSPSAPTNDTAFYEVGNICAKFYPAHQLPSDEQLAEDLQAIVRIYSKLAVGEFEGEGYAIVEGDEPSALHYEDAARFRLHKRIERNLKLSKLVKQQLGYICQVCELDFEKVYGEIGKGYIEAHHLKPLSSLSGKKIAMNPKVDFAVLCANCHRMIHRSDCIGDVEKFRKEHYLIS